MTRINIIPVQCLTNSHLLAEYKEITRPFNKVISRIEKYGVNDALNGVSIPNRYVLGAGHESFFFNKLLWLYKRYYKLKEELLNRGFNIDIDKFHEITRHLARELRSTPYWNQWGTTPEDYYLNMARLTKRSNLQNVYQELNSSK